MVNRHLTGAHFGLRDWLVQRITAVIILAYATGLIAFLLFSTGASFEGWKALFSLSWVKVLTTLSILALLWHAWIGMRDIWMDYIKPAGVRIAMHTLTALWLVGSLIYMIKVVWGVQ
ncbi:MAG: succinate dehydrogenase, hydrophobic membrane anchor protein [Formivibrio sp.]|nr:succinate dehydrogenase, hydrophobic membrane anchor protein [Formivibrio sp.]